MQPEADGLTANMEQNEEEQKEEEVKEKEKLGRLQFKLDYDFNSTNVRIFAFRALVYHVSRFACKEINTCLSFALSWR